MKKLIFISLLLLLPTVALADRAFSPCFGTTKSLDVTDSSGSTRKTLDGANNCGNFVVLHNEGPNKAFCKIGDSTVTAGTSDHVVLAGIGGDPIRFPSSKARSIACVCASGETATVHAETGTVGD